MSANLGIVFLVKTSVTSSDPNRLYVRPGISVPGRLHLIVRDDVAGDINYDVDLRLELDETRARYQIATVTVAQRPNGPEVTSESLRTIPLRRLVRLAVEEAGDITGWSDKDYLLLRPGEGARFAGKGPTDSNLLIAAYVYAIAALSGGTPAKAVAEAFAIEQRTASNWVRKARDRGYLDNGSDSPEFVPPGLTRLGDVNDGSGVLFRLASVIDAD
jgi:hypothetical protein